MSGSCRNSDKPKDRKTMTTDIENMSSKELADLIEAASGKLAQQKEAEKAAVKAELEALAQQRGFTISELFGSEKTKAPRAKVAPVYRDPENPENTWTGRGRKPKWLVAALESGLSIESFRINQS